MSYCKLFALGRLGKDVPDLRYTKSGVAVAEFSIATDRQVNGEKKVEWLSLICFGKTAENVAKYCHKGKQLYIDGKLSTRKWQDKEGRDQWTTEVVANEVRFLGGKAEGSATSGSSGGGGGYGGGSAGGDDDVPFVCLADDVPARRFGVPRTYVE